MTKTYDPRCDADIHRRVPATSPGWNDPLLPDEEGDVRLDVSMRGLVRLALVASEVGARFQREAVDHDAMAWMLAPRRLFGGGNAIEACLRLEPAMRAILLHGLGMGLDADPGDLDELMSDDDDEDVESDADAMGPTADVVPLRPAPPRLFTAVMVDETNDGITHAFGAVVTPDPASARASMRSRHGDRVAATAEIREGFDASEPLVGALVSPAVADMLEHVARDPSSPIARGLEVAVVQRFAE